MHQWVTDASRRLVSREPRLKFTKFGEHNPLARSLTMPNLSRSAKRCTRKALQIFTPFTILAHQGDPLVQSSPVEWWCSARPLLLSCQISSRSENLRGRYLLLNFVDVVTDINSKRYNLVSACHAATIEMCTFWCIIHTDALKPTQMWKLICLRTENSHTSDCFQGWGMCLPKAKFHYAIWSQTGSNLSATSFGPAVCDQDSVMEFGF